MMKADIYDINIHVTLKNVFVNVVDKEGKTVIFYTSGVVGFDGKQKKNKVAVQTILDKLIDKLKQKKISFINLNLVNTAKFTKQIIKSIYVSNRTINRIRDLSSFSHNGCRPVKKKRR